ncbi:MULTISPECIES: DUF1648 domain-containing protein [unclassified Cryobacterium]|uniref:DUF1648 domain-containing protein n=1 Tax=unclassified Cryobacterium TaxID=2649013 RepID=UPI002AB51F67|nr:MULTISPECIES: DUF1648 domain-containing protein [unclassified Cryobacterium]MDY7541158.1 DUF1648 domain-containing protein [Cryobacterium sp. 5B3]MEA9998908.1 DUF1648 domain-containing protein [Cryobacterium sp. RTS3]MEB0265769.1 DUF1648 domain-containing protein [Cryobacterium sp. 10I5]MEB0274271.1 DUF1648 domain-containing protein [Cryobacterium sp. 5B3]
MRDHSEPLPGDAVPPAGADALLDDYFDRLRGAAARLRIDIDADALADLLAHVEHRLDGTDRSDDTVLRVLAELGEPEALARAYTTDDPDSDVDGGYDTDRGFNSDVDHDGGTDAAACGPRDLAAGGVPRTHRAGRFLGVPYDTRQPTSKRFASRSWDPADPSIFVPKALGIGWTVNFAALAVRAHLIRPDDEDEPFAEAPAWVVTATLAAPILAGIAFATLAAVTWAGLPDTVPSHWGLTGEPDGYSSRTANLLLLSGFVLVPLLAAAWVHLARRAAGSRVAASAGSFALALVALACLAQTIFAVQGGAGMWPTWIGLFLALVLPLGLLVGVSRSGRAAEQRRDFASASKKGSVS